MPVTDEIIPDAVEEEQSQGRYHILVRRSNKSSGDLLRSRRGWRWCESMNGWHRWCWSAYRESFNVSLQEEARLMREEMDFLTSNNISIRSWSPSLF